MLASLRAIIPLRIVAMLGAIASVALMIRGLLAVGFTGMPAFGYYAACGTIAFALATFALGRRRSTLL